MEITALLFEIKWVVKRLHNTWSWFLDLSRYWESDSPWVSNTAPQHKTQSLVIELDTGSPASDWRPLGAQTEAKLWRRVRDGHPTGCVGGEISLQSCRLGIIWYKHCKTLSYCILRRKAIIETTLLGGLRQRQRETREVNVAQEHTLAPWSPRRETVMEEEHSGNNSKTLEGRGRCRKGRKLYRVLSIFLQA